jgi:hypothetical protein
MLLYFPMDGCKLVQLTGTKAEVAGNFAGVVMYVINVQILGQQSPLLSVTGLANVQHGKA